MRRTALAFAFLLTTFAAAQVDRASARQAAERQILPAVARAYGAQPVPLASSVMCQGFASALPGSRYEAFIIARPFAQVRAQVAQVQATVNRTARPRVSAVRVRPDLARNAAVSFQYGPSRLLDAAEFHLFALGPKTELCLSYTR